MTRKVAVVREDRAVLAVAAEVAAALAEQA